MTSDATLQNLSEPLLPPAPAMSRKQPQSQQQHDEADCKSQSQYQALTIASTPGVVSSDEADAPVGGIDPSLLLQWQMKINGFVLAIILFFSATCTLLIGVSLSILSRSFLGQSLITHQLFIIPGGPFGVEPSLKAAENLYAIIGFARPICNL